MEIIFLRVHLKGYRSFNGPLYTVVISFTKDTSIVEFKIFFPAQFSIDSDPNNVLTLFQF